jgi:hypothetical protein
MRRPTQRCLDLTYFIDQQVRDAFEVPSVAGEQAEILCQGGRGNEKVKVRNEIALAAEQRAYTRKPFHDRIS